MSFPELSEAGFVRSLGLFSFIYDEKWEIKNECLQTFGPKLCICQ